MYNHNISWGGGGGKRGVHQIAYTYFVNIHTCNMYIPMHEYMYNVQRCIKLFTHTLSLLLNSRRSGYEDTLTLYACTCYKYMNSSRLSYGAATRVHLHVYVYIVMPAIRNDYRIL